MISKYYLTFIQLKTLPITLEKLIIQINNFNDIAIGFLVLFLPYLGYGIYVLLSNHN